MTCDKNMFLTLKKERYGSFLFVNDKSYRIIGRGTFNIVTKYARCFLIGLTQVLISNRFLAKPSKLSALMVNQKENLCT
jgi:hypothetical protein